MVIAQGRAAEPVNMPPAERAAYCAEQRARWGKHAGMTVAIRRFFVA
jgi:hypothetical protein